MGVLRGTTPTVILRFEEPNLDLTEANNVYVTFSSNLKSVTKSGEDLVVEPNAISVYLSQKDTLGFQLDEVEVQANWTYDDKKRSGSNIAKISVDRNLLMKEVE